MCDKTFFYKLKKKQNKKNIETTCTYRKVDFTFFLKINIFSNITILIHIKRFGFEKRSFIIRKFPESIPGRNPDTFLCQKLNFRLCIPNSYAICQNGTCFLRKDRRSIGETHPNVLKKRNTFEKWWFGEQPAVHAVTSRKYIEIFNNDAFCCASLVVSNPCFWSPANQKTMFLSKKGIK